MIGKMLREKRWLTVGQNLSSELQLVIKVAIAFFTVCFLLLLYRHYSFYDSYDQGIFNQLFWNSIQGRLFEGSLSSSLSTNVLNAGQVPEVFYHHLGQHFNPIFLLWLPLYAVFPGIITLILIQVSLMTASGLVLYALARQYLIPQISAMIAISWYGANTVIGPTLGNFHDYNSLPLMLFTLFLALEKKWWWLFSGMAILTLAVREDAGVALFSVGVYLIFSRRYPRIGLAICTLSLSYILIVTNLIMPQFSADVSQRMIVERFGQYTDEQPTSTIEAILAIITHPDKIFQEIFSRFPDKIRYLLGHWLPLAFIPAISVDAWLISSFPLLQIMLMKGHSVLAINIRYVMLIVPGFFYGTILWWSKHPDAFKSSIKWSNFSIPRRRFWQFCIGLSLFFTVTSNPNQTLSFLLPDAIIPWVHINPIRQWEHISQIHQVLDQIPTQTSVSATNFLIPPLSDRRAIVRFPLLMQIRNDAGMVENVEYIVADLWRFQQYQSAFKPERQYLQKSVALIDQFLQNQQYGILDFQDGVILLGPITQANPTAIANWIGFRQDLLPIISK